MFNMIMELLKSGTKKHHEQIESKLDLLNRLQTTDDYRRLLTRFYGFYAPVETGIRQKLAAQRDIFDYETRLKTPLLRQDLEKINDKNFRLDALELCRETPVLDNFAQTLGCLYVLEGATLGGQIISRQLRERFDLTPANGAAFFGGYGAQTGSMWKEFAAFATAQAEILQSDDEIVGAAIETFTKFGNWLADSHTLSEKR